MRLARWALVRLKRNVIILVFLATSGAWALKFYFTRSPLPPTQTPLPSPLGLEVTSESEKRDSSDETFESSETAQQSRAGNRSEAGGEQRTKGESEAVAVNRNVHIFYYGWYGTPEEDGQWWHWNHEYIPPWDKADHHAYPTGPHAPPCDIGANFYPQLGPYSSNSPSTIDSHMAMMARAGAGVVVVSWYPPGLADEHGPPSDALVPALLEAAGRHALALALHVEPYEGRSVENLREHLEYVHSRYGRHPAYHRVARGDRSLPVIYLYDSYRVAASQWARLLTPAGDLSVRGGELDAVFLGLLVEHRHRREVREAGFDGFYTYFASDGFSYGSSWRNWRSLAAFARASSLEFVACVGPGYLDTRVRPWNSRSSRARLAGRYYTSAWEAAMAAGPDTVAVTSFNEWHEGTQVEPAAARTCGDYRYEDYGEGGEGMYLDITRRWSDKLANRTRKAGT